MKKNKIPKFKSEKQEKEFWENNDSTEYINWENAESPTLSNLKPSTKTISLRLPVPLIQNLKSIANKQDVPYQSLLKIYLSERVSKELAK